MRDILTVTLNPALDVATSVTHMQANVKLRCAPPDLDPGGGGLNVARAIKLLGGQCRCFVALGGDTGQALLKLLHDFGLEPVIYEAARRDASESRGDRPVEPRPVPLHAAGSGMEPRQPRRRQARDQGCGAAGRLS